MKPAREFASSGLQASIENSSREWSSPGRRYQSTGVADGTRWDRKSRSSSRQPTPPAAGTRRLRADHRCRPAASAHWGRAVRFLSRSQHVALHPRPVPEPIRKTAFAQCHKAAGDCRPMPLRLIETKLHLTYAQGLLRRCQNPQDRDSRSRRAKPLLFQPSARLSLGHRSAPTRPFYAFAFGLQ